MAEGLGGWLRRARETRDLTLDDVESALRIRRRYLQALEVGDYTALPGPIQARGFLRNYARFLGVPVEEALARYEAEVEGRPVQPRPKPVTETIQRQNRERPSVFAPPPTEEEVSTPSQGIPPTLLWILVGAMVFFMVLAGGAYIYLELGSGDNNTLPTPTAPTAPAEQPPVVEATELPEEGPVFVPAVDGTVTIRLEVEEHAWVRFVAGDEVVFQGVAAPGQTLDAVSEEQCLVETGNGGAFHLYVNGEDWGSLGGEGEVIRRAWSPAGEVSPEGS
ncbi:MAG: helix-turn-helix domain-containing protein [Anaerolineae bacterium]